MQTFTYTLTATGKKSNFLFSRWTMSLVITLIAVISSMNVNAQLTGTKNVPGDYTDLAAAIADLNTQGVGSGGVTINVVAGNPQSAPTGGYIIGNTGSAVLTSSSTTNQIIIQGNGNTVTAGAQSAGTVADAIFALVGADWVTIQNFTLQENAANTVTTPVGSNTMTEWGIALLYVTATDGAQNNSIKNNTIGLSASYQNAVGIYSSTGHTLTLPATAAFATATSGLNIGLKVYGNIISNVALGIVDVAPASNASVLHTGDDLGGSSAPTGNSVSYGNNTAPDAAWGGFAAASAGIYIRNVLGINVQYNTVTSGSLTVAANGVLISTSVTPIASVSYTNTISNNNITVTETGLNPVNGINQGYGNATATHNISSNTIVLNQFVTAAATVQVNGILASTIFLNSNISSNNITVNQTTSAGANSGQVTAITNLPLAFTTGSVQTITNNIMTVKQGTTGGTYTGNIAYVFAEIASNALPITTGNISSNQFLTTGSTIRTSGTTWGVYHDFTYVTSVTLNNNIINIDKSGAGAVNGFYSTQSGSSGAVIETGNSVTITGTSTAGQIVPFSESDGAASTITKTINGNTVNINLPVHTGTIFALVSNWATATFNNNNITITSAGAMQMTSIAASMGGLTFDNNTFTLTANGVTPTMNGIIAPALAAGFSYTISNNTFSFSAPAAAASAPSIIAISVSGGVTNNIFGNKVQSVTTGAGSGSATITGIGLAGGTTNNVFKNKIYGITSANTGTATLITGIRASAGTSTHNIYNNYIGLTPSFTGVNSLDAIRGIGITSTVANSTINVHDNTVYINASTTGANLGTTGVWHAASATATTAKLELRNNIIVNLSTPAGTGITSALRRNAASTYGNYAPQSNRNFLFAGTPGAVNAILNDNGTAISSFATFQTTVSPREANSFTDEGFAYATPGSFFISLTGSDPTFLHLVAGISSKVESGGTPVNFPLITDDYDGDTRNSSTPDIGADEFAGTNIYPQITNVSVPSAGCTASSHVINADVTVSTGTISTVTLNYSFNGVAQSPVTMTLSSGNTYTGTIPAAAPGALVTWNITAVSSGAASSTASGTSYKDDPLSGLSATAIASVNPVCAGSATNLSVSVPGLAGGQIGSGTVNSLTNTNIGAFYGTWWGNSRTQILIKASELNASGIFAGSLTALKVTVTGGTPALATGFTIKIGSTAATSISGSFAAPAFTTVYGPTNYTPVAGVNTHTFTTPFVWDGTSNIIVDYCFSNLVTGSSSPTNTVTATPFNSSVLYGADGATPACGIASVTVPSSTLRPNISFVEAPLITAVSWSDQTPTVVGTTNPLTVNPTSTTTYTASITAAACTATSNALTVTATALPAGPNTGPSTQCGTGVPGVFATGTSNGNFRWYTVPTGGTAIPGETASGFTIVNGGTGTYTISTTTTFYVSIFDGVCESLRTPVTATVNQPDAVQASALSTSVCLGGNVDLSASNIAVTPVNNYTYSWAANTTVGSGIPTPPLTGASVSVTPTASGIYTYTVTAVDGSCTTTSAVTVTIKALPVITSATATPSTSCAGADVILTATHLGPAPGSGDIGTNNSGTFIQTVGTPYRTGTTVNTTHRTQYLVLGTELSAAGFVAGNITSLGFTVLNSPTGFMSNFTISMGATAATSLSTTTFSTATLSQVYTIASYSPVLGLNNHVFQTPFVWDGSSNVVINICADLTAGGFGTGTVLATFITPVNTTIATTTGCTATAGTSPGSLRPVLTIGGTKTSDLSNTYNWVWNPGSLSGSTVTVNPAITTTYTVTATDPATTCSNNQTVTVTVNPLPPTPSGTNSEQCGSGLAGASVSSNSGVPSPTFKWYLVPTGGSPVQTGTSTTYQTVVTSTTTFYVSELSATGCESERITITASVTQPDPITAHATVLTVCEGSSVDLSVTYTSVNNVYTFSWAANTTTGSGIPTPPLSGSNQTITPTVAGTYTYTVTGFDADLGCSASSSVTVNVNPVPTSVAAGYTGSACTGTTINLTSSANTGAPPPLNFAEGFEAQSATLPASWSFIPASVVPPSTANNSTTNPWLATGVFATPPPAHSGNTAMVYAYTSFANANAWAFSPSQPLQAGRSYTISWWYNTQSLGAQFPEKLKVTVGNNNSIAAQTTVLWNNGGAPNLTNETYLQATVSFTPSTSGNYYFAWNCYSDADENVLLVDDISITETTPVTLSYSWVSDPAGFTSSQQNPTGVTLNQTTTYTVTALNSLGCSASSSVTVTALVLPNAPIANNSTQCGLHVPTASVSTGGANGTYNWYDSQTGGTLLQAGGSTYNTAISSTTTFWVSESNGSCESLRTPVTVNVTNPPTLVITPSGATTFCLNGSVGLNAASGSDPSYVNFAWSANPPANSGLSAATGASVTATPTAAGTYTYTVVADDGLPSGCSNSALVTVVINPNPPVDSVRANPSVICLGASSSLSAYSTRITNGPASLPATYCVPTQTGASPVTSVTFNTLSNTVTQVSPFYNIYSNTTSVFTGTSYNLTISTGATAIVSVWIDYDRNGVFDASEWIQPYTAATSGTISVLIPANASPGLTGMRVRSRNAGNANTATDACTGFGSGSTHDYAITIVGRHLQNPDFTYAWNPGSLAGSTVSVSPTATTTYTVTITNPITTCSSTGQVTVTVSHPVISIASQTNTCAGGNTGTVDLDAGGGIPPYTFNLNGQITSDGIYTGLAAGDYTANVTDNNGCTATSVLVSIGTNPRPTATISGGGTYCANQNTSTDLTLNFTGTGPWTYVLSNSGGSGTTSNNPATVTVSPSSTTTYTITSLSDANCTSIGADLTGSATVTVNPIPGDPAANVNPQPTCAVGTGTINVTSPLGAGLTYSISGPFGPFQSSPTFPGVSPGNYLIFVQNSFGCFASNTASVTVNAQPVTPTPPTVTGAVNVCPYIATGTQLTYHAASAGATSFTWTVPPTNVTIIGGQGTADLTVVFTNATPPGYAQQANKQIKVTATSSCGTSSQTIFYTLAQIASTPGPISGPTDACPLLGSSAQYSVAPVVGVSSYTWTAQPGVNITFPNGGGINGYVVNVAFPPGFTTSALTVQSVNDCGLSPARSLTITRNAPSTPSPISGPTNVCANIAPGGVAATYSVTNTAGVTYTWTPPAGSTGLTGQGTNTISFTYPNGFTSGTVSVIASTGCGTSSARNLSVTKLNPATPSVIDVINTQPCPNRQYTYTIASYPLNTTQLVWTIPAAGTLVSGQNTTSITVSYPATAVDGAVTIQALSNCGASTVRSVSVKLPACTPPPPGPFVKGNTVITLPPSESMEVNIFPNPSVNDFKLQVITAGHEEINVRVLDAQGRLFKQLTVMPYQTINLGAELKAGAYMIEVRQGKNVKTTRVIKF